MQGGAKKIGKSGHGGRRFLCLLASLVLCVVSAGNARAQGSRKDDIVLNARGTPLAGATIRVCTLNATGQPCAPLALIYSDTALTQAKTNPTTTDGLGNYNFYAAPGRYMIEISGPGITTRQIPDVILPSDPTNSQFNQITVTNGVTAFSLTLTGNLTVAGSASVTGALLVTNGAGAATPSSGQVALYTKSADKKLYYKDDAGAETGPLGPGGANFSTDAIRYVSSNGNDALDGLSWSTPKLTIMAAYDALPSTGGTVYITWGGVAAGPSCTSTAGQGIALIGPTDPNFASPPAGPGWRTFKSVSFIGVGGSSRGSGTSTIGPVVRVNCGGATNPAIWLSGATGIRVENLSFAFPTIFLRVGVDSNLNRSNGLAGGSDYLFWNVTANNFNSPGTASFGPLVDIGSNILWLRIENSLLECNAAAAVSTDNRSCVVVDTGGGAASGLIYIDDTHLTGGGGIRFYANQTGSSSIYVRHTLQQGGPQSQPLFEVKNTGTFTANVDLQGGVSDSGESQPFVKVADGNNASKTCVTGVNQAYNAIALEGPMTVGSCPLSQSSIGASSSGGIPIANVSPQAKYQRGTPLGTILDQVDASRANFGPTLARFTNLVATQLPASWTPLSGGTITTGVTARDGTTNAAKVSSSSGSQGALAFAATRTYLAGDYVYIGVWMQPASTAGMNFTVGVNAALALRFDFGGGTVFKGINGSYNSINSASSNPNAAPYLQTDGGWQWVWALMKVTTPSTGAVSTRFAMQADVAHPMNFYAPLFVHIPASTLALVAAPTFSSASETGNTVTFTTTAAHNLSVGEPIMISGCSIAGYNGEFAIGSTPLTTTFTVFNTNTGLGAPTGCVITPGNDSEMADWALSAASYPDNAPAGSVSQLRRQTFSFGAAGSDFFGVLSHANTANRTYTFQDASGTVAFDNVAQTWSGNQTNVALVTPSIGGETISASPRAVYSAFLPGAITATWTGATLTLDKAITVTRVQVQAKTAPAGCTTNAVVRLSNGTINQDVTVSAVANDSGAISVNYAAAAALTIAVQTAAAGCTTSPADANVVVQYRLQ